MTAAAETRRDAPAHEHEHARNRFAAPVVSSVVAQMLEANPKL